MQATRKKLSYLENFSAYIGNNTTDNYSELQDEINQRNFYKLHERQLYSASMIWYALHLRYTLLQVNRLLLEKFPMLSFPILDKIQRGCADALKALKIVHEKGSFSCDCILIIDEMYLQKSAQYQSGECGGVDKEGSLCKGSLEFMVVGFKLSIPSVVQTIPEVKFNGQWLVKTFIDNIDNLIEFELCIRGIVTDNHSANVNALSVLIKITL